MTLKVIGAGLGRTGTMSLKLALEELGFDRCYHMVEVFAHMPESLRLWEAAARGEPDWEATFAGYAATVDYLGCTFWRELAARYPDAKVILSTRNPDSWFDSVSRTIFSPETRASITASPMQAFFEGTVLADFDKQRMSDRAYMIDRFERWNAAVIAEVPAERLLVFEARQGWEPLCEFLDVAVPDTPYPRVNSSDEWLERGAHPPEPPSLEQMSEMARTRIAAMRSPGA
ncbi:MAG: hypothetical protein J2O44_05990 [Porphyrobacter sp.]|nr:hypothetical protein [Porphyrobacter sp.]